MYMQQVMEKTSFIKIKKISNGRNFRKNKKRKRKFI